MADGRSSLALVSDVLWARTTSSRTEGMVGEDAQVSRLRAGAQGSWSFSFGSAGIAPKLEVGLRHDGGDAETGFGVDLGGGLVWTAPEIGLSLDVEARTLVAHEAEGREDRGLSAALAWAPDSESGLGPAFTLRQEIGGQSGGGLDALFSPDPISERMSSDQGSGPRWTAETGWGMPILHHRFRAEPNLGYSISDQGREVSLGWRLEPLAERAPNVHLNFKLTRRDRLTAPPEHGIGIELRATW